MFIATNKTKVLFEIDDEDYDKVSAYKWHTKKSRPNSGIYIRRRAGQRSISLTSCILGVDPSIIIDHIDGNTLNNKKSNLRITTNTNNVRNQRKHLNSTSGYKGVTWDKSHNKWMAQIRVSHKNYFIGYYDDPLSAHNAYFERAKKDFGEYARAE